MGLDPFFNPSSVAVVGASRMPGKAGYVVVRNIIEFGFAGRVYPINPGAEEILGLKCYPSLEALPSVPDLLIAVLPRERTLGLMEECGRLGVGSVIIPAAGFSDAGEVGRRMEEDVIAVARASGIRVMGPNSIGTISVASGLATSIVTLDRMRPGSLSLFGQTGMFSSGIARWIDTHERYGISKIACLGNKADIDENDLLSYLGSDPETKVIGVYTEGVRDGARFCRVLRDVASRKPVLVLKSGRSEMGRRAIASHTGAMAGADAIYSGLISQAGAVRVGDFEEMLDCAKALEMQPLPAGNRVGVVSITGVGCVLTADSAGTFGLDLPPLAEETTRAVKEGIPDWIPITNPADIWAVIESVGAEKAYGSAARAISDDPSIDMVVAIFTIIPESSLDAPLLFEALRDRHPDKPVAAVLMAGDAATSAEWKRSLEEMGVPTYPSPERAMRALGAMWSYAAARRTA